MAGCIQVASSENCDTGSSITGCTGNESQVLSSIKERISIKIAVNQGLAVNELKHQKRTGTDLATEPNLQSRWHPRTTITGAIHITAGKSGHIMITGAIQGIVSTWPTSKLWMEPENLQTEAKERERKSGDQIVSNYM